jgi:hypothetical protein
VIWNTQDACGARQKPHRLPARQGMLKIIGLGNGKNGYFGLLAYRSISV